MQFTEGNRGVSERTFCCHAVTLVMAIIEIKIQLKRMTLVPKMCFVPILAKSNRGADFQFSKLLQHKSKTLSVGHEKRCKCYF